MISKHFAHRKENNHKAPLYESGHFLSKNVSVPKQVSFLLILWLSYTQTCKRSCSAAVKWFLQVSYNRLTQFLLRGCVGSFIIPGQQKWPNGNIT